MGGFMVSYFNKRFFLKLGFFSGISAGSITYLMWLVINSLQSWDPYRSEVLRSVAWSNSLEVFFYLLIFSALLGFTRKYQQSKSKVILGTYFLTGIFAHIVISIFRNIDIHFSIMVAVTIPLTIFYTGIGSRQWFNWIKLSTMVITLDILYGFVKMILFSDNRFQYFGLPIKAWFFTFLAYGPPLMVTVYIFHKLLGSFYKIDEKIERMKLKDFLKHFYQNDIEYTFSKN